MVGLGKYRAASNDKAKRFAYADRAVRDLSDARARGGAGGAERPAAEAGSWQYQEGTREPYSWFIYYLKDKGNMFYKRWEERFVVDGDAEEAQQPGR